MYTPTLGVTGGNVSVSKGEMHIDEDAPTHQREGGTTHILKTRANTAITRTAESPSCLTREVIQTTCDTGNSTTNTVVETFADTVMDNNGWAGGMRRGK